MAALMPQSGNVYSVSPEVQRQVVELYASIGSYAEVGRRLGISLETARRVIKSPQGSFALEQLLRERARTRALRLGASTDRLIDELDAILDRGDERILNGRRDGDPLTIFIRPGLRDVVSGLAWTTHHMREIADSLSAVDVTSHDVSHEARSQNLVTLKELVALEERRLLLDGERAASNDAPTVDVKDDVSPWSRSRWGGIPSTPRRRVSTTADGDTGVPGLSSSSPDAACMSAADTPQSISATDSSAADTTPPSRDRPCPPAQAREAAPETRGALGNAATPETRAVVGSSAESSSEVTWEDLEEE
jgi:hypothetical protein